MKLDFTTANISYLSLHDVGNPQQGEQLYLTQEPIKPIPDELAEILLHFFLKPFSQPVYYRFQTAGNDLSLHPIYAFADRIFSDNESFHENSIHIARHLFDNTRHPSIKSGDLYVSYINHCLVDEHICDAIGIFKSEQKEPFLISSRRGKAYKVDFDRGVDINKPDKGCIILNLKKEDGYRVCSFDRNSRGADARFWSDDFLQIKPVADSFHMTQNILTVAKAFVTEKLPEEFDVTKTEQIDLLNRSVNYFKTNNMFESDEFTKHIFGDEQVIDSFNKFKNEQITEADLDLKGSFAISEQAVKKQARIFKSVLKLDKNFHIYIHGNRDLIEKGTDENGKKYYKIFYTEEH
jgi:hypothetical protein